MESFPPRIRVFSPFLRGLSRGRGGGVNLQGDWDIIWGGASELGAFYGSFFRFSPLGGVPKRRALSYKGPPGEASFYLGGPPYKISGERVKFFSGRNTMWKWGRGGHLCWPPTLVRAPGFSREFGVRDAQLVSV